jgi:hypothetical protein
VYGGRPGGLFNWKKTVLKKSTASTRDEDIRIGEMGIGRKGGGG